MTLPFDPRNIHAVLALFEVAVPLDEAAELAALAGSWEELLAHLLLLRRKLPPEIISAVHTVASGRVPAASPRPPGLDAARLRASNQALAAALDVVIQAETARRVAADALSAALGAHAAERPGTGADLHLRITPGAA